MKLAVQLAISHWKNLLFNYLINLKQPPTHQNLQL